MSDSPRTTRSFLDLTCQRYAETLLPKPELWLQLQIYQGVKEILKKEFVREGFGDRYISPELAKTFTIWLLYADLRRRGVQIYRLSGGTKACRFNKLPYLVKQPQVYIPYLDENNEATALVFSQRSTAFATTELVRLSHQLLTKQAEHIDLPEPYLEYLTQFSISADDTTSTITLSPNAFREYGYRDYRLSHEAYSSFRWVLERHGKPDTIRNWPLDVFALAMLIRPCGSFSALGIKSLTLRGMPLFRESFPRVFPTDLGRTR
ncbi:hypothetical protein K461DRAFT_296519 [Myriangium duriaei CBS 260.36]|uniref:Uncharacterized protein n=1 Tax=Myriangium duriaei CBS 260.36 TaxID=1168546 RepID=A0A9P4IX23_9PEZI|nr:hypothetical protein K461DRAFT_296519 [Myriangium duriaei CBS 260.36]